MRRLRKCRVNLYRRTPPQVLLNTPPRNRHPHQGTVSLMLLFFPAVTTAGGRARSFFLRGNAQPHRKEMIVSCRVCMWVRHPRGSYVVPPLFAVSGGAPHQNIFINSSTPVIHMQENPPQKAVILVGCSSPLFMRLARTPHVSLRALGASNVCLVGENPTCSVPAL